MCHGWSQNKGFVLLWTPLGDAGWEGGPHFPPYEPEKQRKPVFREREKREVETKNEKGLLQMLKDNPPPPTKAGSALLGARLLPCPWVPRGTCEC